MPVDIRDVVPILNTCTYGQSIQTCGEYWTHLRSIYNWQQLYNQQLTD